ECVLWLRCDLSVPVGIQARSEVQLLVHASEKSPREGHRSFPLLFCSRDSCISWLRCAFLFRVLRVSRGSGFVRVISCEFVVPVLKLVVRNVRGRRKAGTTKHT